MLFKILAIREDDNGYLHVDYQCDCGPDGDVMNSKTGPFTGSDDIDPWEDLRLWLALNAELHDQVREPQSVPPDIAELVGKPVDTSELRQRFRPQLEAFNARAALAQEQRDRPDG